MLLVDYLLAYNATRNRIDYFKWHSKMAFKP